MHVHPKAQSACLVCMQGDAKASFLQVTISLLEEAMLKADKQQVLIDGFPRNEENRAAFESQVC